MGFDGNSPITGYDIECKNKSGKPFTPPHFTSSSLTLCLLCFSIVCPQLLHITLEFQSIIPIWSIPGMNVSRFLSVSRFTLS